MTQRVYPGPVSQRATSAVDDGAAGLSIGQDARKLTVYFGERTQGGSGGFIADQLLDLFGRHRVATSILLRGIEGFGIRHHLRSDQSLSLSDDPPLVAVAVDSTPRIEALLDEVSALNLRGLITLERARLVHGGEGPLPVVQDPREAVKLTVYVGRQERSYRVPTFMAVSNLMHRRGISGASVFLGVDGTAHGIRQRARFFDGNADVPVMIIAVGDGGRIGAMLPELGALLRRPLLTLERVRVCKRDGVLLGRPHELPGITPGGLALWQKIMVYTSESTLHHGAPIHRALVRRLRSAGTAQGATVIRGIWGFHGNHRPHGDSLFRVRRRAPVCTILVDEPDRIAQSFPLIDEITAEHGLVTSERVPALVSAQPERRHGGFRLARPPN
jgi:PII-like signaling protein